MYLGAIGAFRDIHLHHRDRRMQTPADMPDDHHFEHSDVIRVIGHSHDSFDDAVSTALQQLARPEPGHDHHPGYQFVSFKVVDMGGVLEHSPEKKTCEVTHFSVRLDVEARHHH